MKPLMIKVENLSKQYRLGQIGGTTLRDSLQRLTARILHKEDPTIKIGEKEIQRGDSFMALSNISFEVKQGERVGIIGHNGAGKSTLLKLISRITAPTDGSIYLNGRVASMLEVGTGFNGELTGRENAYMNGAILGMKKKEIDLKINDIIEFSECRKFIDTPVKRYSSGMYVKLAFAVAAHLDSEILIMDEVLAVGDVAFQKKCMDKMCDVSYEEGRTILYVSHNMNTIRQMCDRTIVLNHGKIIHDGSVEDGIEKYIGVFPVISKETELSNLKRGLKHLKDGVSFSKITLGDREKGIYSTYEPMKFHISLDCTVKKEMAITLVFIYSDNTPALKMRSSNNIEVSPSNNNFDVEIDASTLVPGKYKMVFSIHEVGEYGAYVFYDDINDDKLNIEIIPSENFNDGIVWNHSWWGHNSSNKFVIK